MLLGPGVAEAVVRVAEMGESVEMAETAGMGGMVEMEGSAVVETAVVETAGGASASAMELAMRRVWLESPSSRRPRWSRRQYRQESLSSRVHLVKHDSHGAVPGPQESLPG